MPNSHYWTKRFPAIVDKADGLSVRSAVLDGGAVIFDEHGRPIFTGAQADYTGTCQIALCSTPSKFWFLEGEDLCANLTGARD